MRILVICAAGASSTFVAQRLSRAAERAGLDWQATPGAEQTLLDALDADLVLIGPHLEDKQDRISAALSPVVPVVTLPPDVYSDFDGSRTLAVARSALAPRTGARPTDAHPTKETS